MTIGNILTSEELAFIKTEFPEYNSDLIILNGDLNDNFAEDLENYYQLKAFDKNYRITEKGKLAESIIDKLDANKLW